jgi:hypothetical protein
VSLPVAPYVPNPREQAALQRMKERRARTAPSPRLKVDAKPEAVEISSDHPDSACATALLSDAFGSADGQLIDGLLKQLTNVSRTGKTPTSGELNFMLAVVRGIGPKDETEALIAVQMAAIHNATMMAAARLNRVDNIPQQDSASNMLNKLARTFVGQVEGLKKYRSSGEQHIRVQHVSVNEGGQAIVAGEMQTGGGGGGAAKNGRQSHELGAPQAPSAVDARSPALLGHIQALRLPLPGSGPAEQDCVPVSRRPGGCAKGDGERCLAARKPLE